MISSTPRNAPSAYPFPLTYIVTSVSFIFSTVATGLLGYFIYYLRMDSMSVPYEFIILIITSTFTLTAHLWTTYTHIFRTLGPKPSLLTHAILQILWLVSTVLISRKIAGMVLSHSCSLSAWETDMGVMVCHIYKALYAFIILSTASIAACLVLDLTVLRQTTSRGAYREMKDRDYLNQQQYSSVGGVAARAAALWHGVKDRTAAAEPMAGTAPPPAAEGYMRGFALDAKRSPELGTDLGDAQRLVASSPDPGYTPYQTPRL